MPCLFAQQVKDEISTLIAKSVLVKTTHGEISDEYLTSLDEIVFSAFDQEQYDIAFKYRNIHIDIISMTDGVESLNYAIDMTRLGNISCFMYPEEHQAAIQYYTQSYNIFNKLKAYRHNFYILTLQQLGILYSLVGQYDQALQYQEKYLSCVKNLEGANSVTYLNACADAIDVAIRAELYDAVNKYSKDILRNFGKLTNENFAAHKSAIYAKYEVLWRQGNVLDAINTLIDYLSIIQNFIGCINAEYVSCLDLLSNIYSLNGNYETSIEVSLATINIIETIYQGDKESMRKDMTYYNLCKRLSALYVVLQNGIEEFKYSQEICEILKVNNLEESAEYAEALCDVFAIATSIGEYSYAMSIADDVERLIPKYSSNPNSDMLMFLAYMYDISVKSYKYDLAIEYFEKCMNILPELYTDDSLLFNRLILFASQIDVYKILNNKVKALQLLSLAKEDYNGIKNKSHIFVQQQKANLLRLEGVLCDNSEESIEYLTMSLLQYNEIECLLEECTNEISRNKGEDEHSIDVVLLELQNQMQNVQSGVILVYMDRGLRYYNDGKCELAYDDFKAASILIETTKSKNSSDYIVAQNNIALCEMEMGRYSDAIKTLDDISIVARQQFGDDSYLYATCLLNYGIYYQAVFDYERLLDVSLVAQNIYERLYGTETLDYARASANAGVAYTWMGDHDKAEKNLAIAYAIISKQSDSENDLLLAKILQNIGNLFCVQKKYEEADAAYVEAKNIIARVCGECSMEMAVLLAGYGRECALLGLDLSMDCFALVLDIIDKLQLYSDKLAPYSSILYGYSCLIANKEPMPEYSQIAMHILKEYYANNFIYFTEQDRANVWNIVQMYKNVLFSAHSNATAQNILYDYCLYSKSLLLATSNNFMQAVISSGDIELMSKYDRMQDLKKDQVSYVLHDYTLQPTSEVAKLEREIISALKQSSSYTHKVNYSAQNVLKSLSVNDVAIEFVSYTNLLTSNVEYRVFVLSKHNKFLQFVELCDSEELEKYYAQGHVAYQDANSTKLYDLIWSKLEPYINEGDDVYFAPDGLLYQMNIEVLQDANGKRANQKWNLHRVSSTRELCMEKPEVEISSAALYGGLIYDVEENDMLAQSRAYTKDDGMVASSGFIADSTMRAGWTYLDGSKSEIEAIAQMCTSQNIEAKVYTSITGNEESFKALSGMKTPIIHLATHGFFYKNEEVDNKPYFESMNFLEQPIQRDNSLKRSGLILAGAQKAWLGNPIPDDVEDGILLAEEIAAMDLTGTDLVVLSACETGLGEITSEGVFGLQRAFKKAGVQTLIMSLWKVDDTATSLFMQTFYEHWLGGKTKHEAFAMAQDRVRSEYSNPYYWAGFIMLD